MQFLLLLFNEFQASLAQAACRASVNYSTINKRINSAVKLLGLNLYPVRLLNAISVLMSIILSDTFESFGRFDYDTSRSIFENI